MLLPSAGFDLSLLWPRRGRKRGAQTADDDQPFAIIVDGQNRPALVEDLETQRRAIVEQIAKADATEALPLIWWFMALNR